jgi:hypothetical protein
MGTRHNRRTKRIVVAVYIAAVYLPLGYMVAYAAYYGGEPPAHPGLRPPCCIGPASAAYVVKSVVMVLSPMALGTAVGLWIGHPVRATVTAIVASFVGLYLGDVIAYKLPLPESWWLWVDHQIFHLRHVLTFR